MQPLLKVDIYIYIYKVFDNKPVILGAMCGVNKKDGAAGIEIVFTKDE
jgi:hypothetical protein